MRNNCTDNSKSCLIWINYYISTEIIGGPSLDVPFSRVKCAGTLQSSGSSSSVACLILERQGSWMMLEKQTIRHAPNASRACRLVLPPLPCILFQSLSLHFSFAILSTGRFECSCITFRFHVTEKSANKILNHDDKYVVEKSYAECIISCALIHCWRAYFVYLFKSYRNYSSCASDKTACWIIIGHRLLSSAFSVSSYVKPQTGLMNDLPKVSGISEIPGESCICTDGIRA